MTDGPSWLTAWMQEHGVALWGAADLGDLKTPRDGGGAGFPRAVSFVVPMDPRIMHSIQDGPNQRYADEYGRANERINQLAEGLALKIRTAGFRAQPLAASERTDLVDIRGDFPHKTAATRAGVGWIGRHCQLVTRPFGPWVRLGTVFTDMTVVCGPAEERSHCGTCMRCVEACPAKALKGQAWSPGLAREEILDAQACDRWKKRHYYRFHEGHNCGICSAVCPHGLRLLRNRRGRRQHNRTKADRAGVA
jgi:epoxyqueuosine reductase